MAGTTYVKVDFEKLEALIKAAAGNISRAEQSIGCGHAISNARRKGILSKPVVYAIESEYGITYDDYAEKQPCEETDAVKNPAVKISDNQWKLLGELIYQCAKMAIEDAYKAINEQQEQG